MPNTIDAMRHLAKLSVMMFVTMLLQVTVNAVPIEEPTNNSDIPNDCECVPFYMCTNETINVYGNEILDLRSLNSPCSDYTEQCCKHVGESRENIPTNEIRPTNKEKHTTCGHRNSGGVGFKITGDTHNEAQFGEFPWMVAILNLNPSTQIQTNMCGGSLIHPRVVLTAAHCVHEKNEDHLVIRAGEWDSQTVNEMYKHQDRQVLKIIKHEQFNIGTAVNDVAIIIVTEPFSINDHVDTICLPSQNFEFFKEKCYATGWGKNTFNKTGKYQNILKKIDLPIVPRDPCLELLRTTRLTKYFILHESFICAGGEVGKDTCTGDGGSPLMCPVDDKSEQYVQAGIVAWGIGCGTKIPGVYANVAMFRNWIDEKMINENLETKYYDPKSDTNINRLTDAEKTLQEKIEFVYGKQTR